jgi:TolB-like protein
MAVDLAREADFRLGEILVRPSIRQVEAKGETQTLEPRVLQVLIALRRRSGQVVSRDELVATCWEGRAVSDDAIHRCISRLRKLGGAHTAFEIETIPKVGYRLVAEGSEATPEAAPVAQAGEGAPPSIAVLPFVNRSGLPEDEVFADGMLEDLVYALSHYPHWRVLGSVVTAGLRKAADADLSSVGRQLGVDYVLDGNVRRTGQDLRVTTQLVDAANGAVIWSGRFDRPLSELGELQENLVVEMAGALGMEIHVVEMQRALKKPGDITAWEAITRSMAGLRQTDPASLMRAMEEAKRAVEIAPDYPIGHGLLAATSALVYFILSPDNPAEVQRIRALADKALAMGQDNAFVLSNASGALAFIGLPQLALDPLERARRRAPGHGPAWYVSGCTYTLLNRIEEAFVFFDTAERLMPVPYMTGYIKEQRGSGMIRLGRWAEAERFADEALAINPMHFTQIIAKAMIAWLGQRREEAHALFAPIRQSGVFQLEQLQTLYRRVYAGSAVQDDLLAALAALWAEPKPT